MTRVTVVAAALALLALAPAAAADGGALRAESVGYRGGALQHGDLAAFYVASCVAVEDQSALVDDCAASGSSPLLGLEVSAQQMEALVVERRSILLGAGAVEQQDPRYPNDAPAQRIVLEQARGVLRAQQDLFQVHVLPLEGGAVPKFNADTQSGSFESMDALFMAGGQFRRAVTDDEDARNPDASQFWSVRVDEPIVVHEDEAGQVDVTFHGDLVLEVKGATLAVADADEQHVLESGAWSEAPAADLAASGIGAQTQRDVLLRLFLIGATLRLTVQGGNPGLFLAAPEVTSDHAGESTLVGATGTASRDGEEIRLDDERFVVPAGSRLTLRPAAEALDLSFAPSDGAPGAIGAQPLRPQASIAVAAVAVAALLAAMALGLARRWTSAPELSAVEAAIEAQHYGRAARLAKRILRVQPASEDAMLGRVIALSKSGRAGAAISEIHAHLERREPSDGSLHYVLGLALLDVGRPEDARTALEEAVRLTPALEADVAARLGPQASSSPGSTPLREVHGYA